MKSKRWKHVKRTFFSLFVCLASFFALLNHFGKIGLFFWFEHLKQDGFMLASLVKQSTLITVSACWLKAV